MKKIILLLIMLLSISFAKNNETRFYNPILAGFYPDPSICKVGDDYYLVNSTFAYFPAIPVFHSKDLVNWKLIGHVLDRAEQLDLNGFGVSRGIFAPAIRYYDGIFYVTCTVVDGGGNFVVTSKDPAGPWSEIHWLPEIRGIDPSLFFDDDGKAYITYNSDAPDNKPLYEGHRTIRIVEFDYKNLKVVSEPFILVNGGVDITQKPIWIEGPHIYKINGIYYLNCAEGGTAEDHRQVIFRSNNVMGPYIAYEKNPILTQRHLDPKRPYPVTCTGHADFVQTPKGDWWAVFLACRPYEPFEENYYNTGRETFLAPIKWFDGWPVINPDFEEVQYSYEIPIEPLVPVDDIPYNSNFTIRDNFDSTILHPSWIFLRTPKTKWYSLEERKGMLTIKLLPQTCSGNQNPAFVARRQQHSKGYGMTALHFSPRNENEKAGLVIFQDESHFYYLCKSKEGRNEVVQLFQSDRSEKDGIKLIASRKLHMKAQQPLLLKIETKGRYFAFYYGTHPDKLWLLKDEVDATFLSIKKAWGFVGNMYAMYATSLGSDTNSKAYFDWFEYNGNDDIYKQ